MQGWRCRPVQSSFQFRRESARTCIQVPTPGVNQAVSRFSHLPWVLLFAAAALSAAEPAGSAPAKAPAKSEFVFSLIPKSLQKNPHLSLNVITELTADGKKLATPTEKKPAYYIFQMGGNLQLGEAAPANEKDTAPAELERLMRKSLAEGHYLPADPPAHQPSLVLIYRWGSYSLGDDEPEPDDPSTAVTQLHTDKDAEALLPQAIGETAKQKQLYERASLVGGIKFANELMKVIQEESQLATQENAAGRVAAVAGNTAPELSAAFSPFAHFRDRDLETLQLVEDSFSSCYFVIVSAFDYQSVATKEKVLLWRTKMTVNSLGVAFVDTAPALIANAGGYFGREMTQAVTTSQRVVQDGKVKIGTPTVVPDATGDSAPTEPAPAAPTKP